MEEQNVIVEEQTASLQKFKMPDIKIIIAAVAAIAIIVVICIIAFSSPIPTDYKELRRNLRDAGYEVESITEGSEAWEVYTDFISTLMYYYDEGLEEEAYALIEDIHDTISESDTKDIEKSAECAVVALDEYEENFIIVLYFDESKYAKEFSDIFDPFLEFIKENGSDSHVFDEIKREDFVFGQNGKMVYIATKTALDDCK